MADAGLLQSLQTSKLLWLACTRTQLATIMRLVACVLLAWAAASAAAPYGSWLSQPASRSRQDLTQYVDTEGPCDAEYSGSQTTAQVVQRGQTIPVRWPRNGRSGGMIRIAWALAGSSDGARGHANFNALVESYSCFEAACSAANGCNDGTLTGCTACQRTVVVPSLPDGVYAMQW